MTAGTDVPRSRLPMKQQERTQTIDPLEVASPFRNSVLTWSTTEVSSSWDPSFCILGNVVPSIICRGPWQANPALAPHNLPVDQPCQPLFNIRIQTPKLPLGGLPNVFASSAKLPDTLCTGTLILRGK